MGQRLERLRIEFLFDRYAIGVVMGDPSALKTLRWHLDRERDALARDEDAKAQAREQFREARRRIVARNRYISDLESAIVALEGC